MSPLADGACRSQLIVTVTFAVRSASVVAQVLPKFRVVGEVDLLTLHVYAEPWFADMSFDSSCGLISLTGIDTSAAPMPETVISPVVASPGSVTSALLAWSDE